METNVPAPLGVRPLVEAVARRLTEEPSGSRALSALRTAAELVGQAGASPDSQLRFAESAAYNVRQALDAITGDADPAVGGLRDVLAAWDRYQRERTQPDVGEEEARASLEGVIERNRRRQNHDSERQRRMITRLERQSGLSRFPCERDPVVEYGRLRADASKFLHDEAAVGLVVDLYQDTVVLFERLFMSPDARHDALVVLARSPVAGADELDRLQILAVNAHHLSLFFSHLQSTAWIDSLWDAGLITLPEPGEPWPLIGLVDAFAHDEAECIADLLRRMLDNLRTDVHEPEGLLLALDGVARAARRLGAAGISVGMSAIRDGISAADRHQRRPQFFKFLAVEIAREADPADEVVADVADLALAEQRHDEMGYRSSELLTMLEGGLTTDNAKRRVEMVAAKVRRLSREPGFRFLGLDGASLTTEPGGREEPIVVLSFGLARLLLKAQREGAASSELLDWIDGINDPLGARLRCQVLASASDVPLGDKIAFVVSRLSDDVPTGDDVLLIDAVVAASPSLAELEPWSAALGLPSVRSPEDEEAEAFPDDWARVWRWSTALPPGVLEPWRDVITAVAEVHGQPSRERFSQRTPSYGFATGGSPYSPEQLGELKPLDAAHLIATWRPDDRSSFALVSARELGRALEEVVAGAPSAWTADSSALIAALRHPTYVDHYFRAVGKAAKQTATAGGALVEAAAVIATHPWDVETLGSDDFEYDPDWSHADTAAVEMIEALANRDATFGESIDTAWSLTSAALHDRPDNIGPALEAQSSHSDEPDPLASAINRPYSKALQTVFALGWWEHRNTGQVRAECYMLLDEVIALPGWIGLEYRAVIAARRLALEVFARDWLETNQDELFGELAPDSAGKATFELTLKWSPRTSVWFLGRFRNQLFAAGRRQAEHAISSMLVGCLWGVTGYEADTVLDALRTEDPAPTADAAEEMASLVQDADAGSDLLETAVGFWQTILDRFDRQLVPTASLLGLGRWVFVKSLDDRRFEELTLATVERSVGAIDYVIEVADRLAESSPSVTSLNVLRMLLDAAHAEAWERDHVQSKAVEAARRATAEPDLATEVLRLRDRLLELGRHDARGIEPPSA